MQENREGEFHELISVVENAGLLARTYFESDSVAYEQKPDQSVVTEVDRNVEEQLLAFITKKFPTDAVVGEEHGVKGGTSGFVWHIDPIDATDNFLRKIPFCAISVARLGDTNEDSFGVVHNPITKQTFASLMENGVYENKRLHALTSDTLGGRLVISVGTGKAEPWMQLAKFALYKAGSERFGKCGAYGCTALELAYLAANRIDAYLTFGLKSYDYAAGLFLCRAAGAAISVFENGAWRRYDESLKALCGEHGATILVSHPDIHDELTGFIGDPKAWATR